MEINSTAAEIVAEFTLEQGYSPAIAFFRQFAKLEHLIQDYFDKKGRHQVYLDRFMITGATGGQCLFSVPIHTESDFDIALTALGDAAAQMSISAKAPPLKKPALLDHLERLVEYYSLIQKSLETQNQSLQLALSFKKITIVLPCRPQASFYATKHGFPSRPNLFTISVTDSHDFIPVVLKLKDLYGDLQKYAEFIA